MINKWKLMGRSGTWLKIRKFDPQAYINRIELFFNNLLCITSHLLNLPLMKKWMVECWWERERQSSCRLKGKADSLVCHDRTSWSCHKWEPPAPDLAGESQNKQPNIVKTRFVFPFFTAALILPFISLINAWRTFINSCAP